MRRPQQFRQWRPGRERLGRRQGLLQLARVAAGGWRERGSARGAALPTYIYSSFLVSVIYLRVLSTSNSCFLVMFVDAGLSAASICSSFFYFEALVCPLLAVVRFFYF